MAISRSKIRLWIAGISSAVLLGYSFVVPALSRPVLEEGLHNVFLAGVSSAGIVAAVPVLWTGSTFERVGAVALSVLPALGMLLSVTWFLGALL
jgi:hypothetical protein